MLRKVGLAISYFISSVYFLSILLPAVYCLRHGCHGPELDAFMPAFMLTPMGGIATAFSLRNAIRQIRKRQPWSWIFWPLAMIFAIILLCVIALIGFFVHYTVFHRSVLDGRAAADTDANSAGTVQEHRFHQLILQKSSWKTEHSRLNFSIPAYKRSRFTFG